MALYTRKVTLRQRPTGALAVNYFGADDANKISDHTEGWINVKEAPYSAAGDGVTDDTGAIALAMVDASGKTLFFPEGTYATTGAFNVPAFTRIVGASRENTVLLSTHTTQGMFVADWGVEIRDLTIKHGVTPITGSSIRNLGNSRIPVGGSPGVLGSALRIENVRIMGPYEGIRVDDYTGPFPTVQDAIQINVFIQDVIINDLISVGILFRHVADAHISKVWIDGGLIARLGQGIRFEDFCEGVEVTGAEIIACNYGLVMQSQGGGGTTGREFPAASFFSNCYFDSNVIDGAYLYGAVRNSFSNCWFGGNGRNGVTWDLESWGNIFTNCVFYANQGWGFQKLADFVVNLRLSISNSIFSENWSGGVYIPSAVTNFVVQGNHFSALLDHANPHASDYGVFVTTGASDYYVIADNTYAGMSIANVSDGGSGVNKRVELNPSPSGGGLVVSSIPSASRPTPGAGNAGTFIRVRDTNTSETLEMCLQNSDGSYSWTVVATAPV